MGLLNKIGEGMMLVGIIGGLYTCTSTVPKPLLEEGDNQIYKSYNQHPDYYWVPETFGGLFMAGLVLDGFASAYWEKKKEKKKE